MAPRTRNTDKKPRRSHKREVRFPRREIPVRKSATVIRPPGNYENLILYYLTKLKRLFTTPGDLNHPHPKGRENSADRMRRMQLEEKKSKPSGLEINANKYTASHTAPKPREEGKEGNQGPIRDSEIKEKVYNVVTAAIEYGFANNVLEKKGDCFVFKNNKKSKIANRQPTPGPSGVKKPYCSHCSCINCKNLSNTGENNNSNYRECHNARPMSENTTRREHHRKLLNIHESKTQHPLRISKEANNAAYTKRSSRSKSCTITPNNYKYRSKKVCNCSKCRALEQRRKMQRK